MNLNATFLISAISFIIFVFIMNAIFYKPVQKIIKERQKFIDENYDAAKRDNNIAQKLTADREEKLQQTKTECKTLMEEKITEAKENKASMISDAQKQSLSNISEYQNKLNNAYNETKNNMRQDVSALTGEISQKLFGDKVSLDNVNDDEINRAMQEG